MVFAISNHSNSGIHKEDIMLVLSVIRILCWELNKCIHHKLQKDVIN